jgi:purine-cytosine permease-like protein
VAVAAGGVGATLALLAVTVDETDEAFANVYSTAVSIQNLAPRLPQRGLVVAVSVVATLGALTIDLLSYQTFLLLLGSFFVPLFGVLLADWLAAGSHYSEQDVFGGPAVRPGMVGAGLRALPLSVAVSDRAALVGRPRRARSAGLSVRRCRAAVSSRSGSYRDARQAAPRGSTVGRRWAALQ